MWPKEAGKDESRYLVEYGKPSSKMQKNHFSEFQPVPSFPMFMFDYC